MMMMMYCCVCQTYTYEQLKSMVETHDFAPDVDRESLEVVVRWFYNYSV